MAIIVSDMCKSFHGVTALDSTSFMVADGEFFSLLGPEKSGKSTIISCLSTLSNPDSGLAEINGRTLGVADESIAADIGVLFESIFLDLNLTVRGNISFYAALHGISDEGLDDLAARLDITAILHRRLGTVSIGEQRRVDLARALVHAPSVLLMDEPVKGLDPHSASVIWNVIGEELDQGTTILMATEDADTALKADRVGILVDGRVLASGTPDSLISDFCPSVLLLRLADPEVSARELASVGIGMSGLNPEGQVELQLDSASARDVIAFLGDQVLTFEFRNGTLDEVVRVLSRQETPFSTDDVREYMPVPPDDRGTVDDQDEYFLDEDIEVDFDEDTGVDAGEYMDADAGEDTDAVRDDWDGRVIAPVWSAPDVPEGPEFFDTDREEPRFSEDATAEPWDDGIYIRSDFRNPDSALIRPRVFQPTFERTPPAELVEPADADEEFDDQWDDADDQWADEPDSPEPEHWLRARGFADTGRRGDYRTVEPYQESVHRTDYDDDDSAYDEAEYDDGEYTDAGYDEIEGAENAYDAGYANAGYDDTGYVDAGYADIESTDAAYDVDDDSAYDAPVVPGRRGDDLRIDMQAEHDYLHELNEVIWEEQRRVDQADQLDRLAIVTRLLEDAVLTDPLPPFDETFPIDRLPFVARDFSAAKPRRTTTWYEEMRRPINEEMAKQARIQLAVEKRIEEARRRLDEQGGLT